MKRPDPGNWRTWQYEDYLRYFLSIEGVRQRMKGRGFPLDALTDNELWQFCAPIRTRIEEKFGRSESPRVSIALVAYNEERELIPTLLSYTLLDCPPGLAELIVVDNNSTDRTRDVIQACGARYVLCKEQGTPFARAAGLAASHPDTEYIWMSDGDVRVVPPIKREEDLLRPGTVFQTAYRFLEAHPRTVGVSTGAVIEHAHWSYRLIHILALKLKRTSKYSCWSGSNQFVRKRVLAESGGIDTSVLFGEDQYRHFQLARWAKANKMHLNSANMSEEIADPVYYSGRRYATLGHVILHLWDTLKRGSYFEKDEYGWALHKKNIGWRQVR
ncbi:glycosyltransferase [Rhodocaloribacter litoris]|uniref:glycosyltransferase family 2 protein n=1 Tax=Rhodocaloribacter litoris TaxID=2558931 RepID=UPI00141DEBBC|nr:glycosyltransferase [Rhodocaloribacter litoris]QXD16174.1 glycosyltransferase [Rhodocaloribacter litoris]